MKQWTNEVINSIDGKAAFFAKVNDEVWAQAETGFKEVESAKILEQAVASQGFTIESGVADIPTAFIGTYGSGKPVIGFLAEYDALAALSQKAGVPVQDPVTPGGNGHGCGHNSLGAGALAAAVAVKEYLEKSGVPGTVKFFGCPGEEYGSGKMFMARAGYFNDVDAAFTWHPSAFNEVVGVSSLACIDIFYRFHGKTAHAAGAPHLGRSALDAAELMNVGVNYMREHMPSDCRIHYAYHDCGGVSPNVVQDTAVLQYFVRAPKVKIALELTERVHNVARGAALMTDTSMTFQVVEGLCDYVPNDTLTQLLYDCFQQTGAPAFDEKDFALAKQFVFSEAEKDAAIARMSHGTPNPANAKYRDVGLVTDILPYELIDYPQPGSTDVGDVSYCTPTAQLHATCYALGTPGHTWQITSQCGSHIAHKGVLAAGKAMALAGICCLNDPALLEKAKAEYVATTGGQYICPVSDDVTPDMVI